MVKLRVSRLMTEAAESRASVAGRGHGPLGRGPARSYNPPAAARRVASDSVIQAVHLRLARGPARTQAPDDGHSPVWVQCIGRRRPRNAGSLPLWFVSGDQACPRQWLLGLVTSTSRLSQAESA